MEVHVTQNIYQCLNVCTELFYQYFYQVETPSHISHFIRVKPTEQRHLGTSFWISTWLLLSNKCQFCKRKKELVSWNVT